jgi:hypothetical protein
MQGPLCSECGKGYGKSSTSQTCDKDSRDRISAAVCAANADSRHLRPDRRCSRQPDQRGCTERSIHGYEDLLLRAAHSCIILGTIVEQCLSTQHGASGTSSVLIASLSAPPMLLFRPLSVVLMPPLLVVAAMAVFWYRELLLEYSVVYPSTKNDYASTQETAQMEPKNLHVQDCG